MTEQTPTPDNNAGDIEPGKGFDELLPGLKDLTLEQRRELVDDLVKDAEQELGVTPTPPVAQGEAPTQPPTPEAAPEATLPPAGEQQQ